MSGPVVVSGVGVVGAAGRGLDSLWDVCVGARSALVPAPFAGAPEGALVGIAPPVERRDVVRTPVGRRIDRLSLMVLAAARDALADAGLDDDAMRGDRTGIVLGSAFGNFGETAGFLDRLGARGSGNPLVFPNLVMNGSLSYLSIELGVTGPTIMVTQQEISGEAALAAALDLVESGTVDRCLVGAGDELTPELHAVLREVGALAVGRPRVFDATGDGYVPGEGAAVFVMERAPAAGRRGVRPWARLARVDEFSVAAPVHGWPVDHRRLGEHLSPTVSEADLVVASAAGLPGLDRVQARGLAAVLRPGVPVAAPRARVGHFGSAGIMGAALAIAALRHQTAPPGPGCDAPLERALTFLEGPRTGVLISRVAVVGIARGGACCSLTFEDPA